MLNVERGVYEDKCRVRALLFKGHNRRYEGDAETVNLSRFLDATDSIISMERVNSRLKTCE